MYMGGQSWWNLQKSQSLQLAGGAPSQLVKCALGRKESPVFIIIFVIISVIMIIIEGYYVQSCSIQTSVVMTLQLYMEQKLSLSQFLTRNICRDFFLPKHFCHSISCLYICHSCLYICHSFSCFCICNSHLFDFISVILFIKFLCLSFFLIFLYLLIILISLYPSFSLLSWYVSFPSCN